MYRPIGLYRPHTRKLTLTNPNRPTILYLNHNLSLFTYKLRRLQTQMTSNCEEVRYFIRLGASRGRYADASVTSGQVPVDFVDKLHAGDASCPRNITPNMYTPDLTSPLTRRRTDGRTYKGAEGEGKASGFPRQMRHFVWGHNLCPVDDPGATTWLTFTTVQSNSRGTSPRTARWTPAGGARHL